MERDTPERITLAALNLFMKQGIKKTSVDDVALAAGVTRVTVYRYFADKRELVRAAFMRIEQVFQGVLDDMQQRPDRRLDDYLEQLGRGLGELPSGDQAARAEELSRVYPDIYAEFQEMRLTVEGAIFQRIFQLAEDQGRLRQDLRRDVAQAILRDVFVNLFENPDLRGLGLSNQQLFEAVSDIMLHGIIINSA